MITNHTNGHSRTHPPSPDTPAKPPCEPLAIIGIGCRFPGRAQDPDSFWGLLTNGVDAIAEVPAERWNKRTFYDPEIGKLGKTHACWGGFLEGIDQFDPHFFGISPREASRMDPQQRLLLEAAWEALEDGGQVLERLSGSNTSVFVGIASWDYSFMQTNFRDRACIDVYTNTGGSLSIAANRISYCFDFRGPSAAVDTACSSSLLAVHLACKSIWEDQCTLALAGGVNALLLPDWFVGFSRLGMLSPDGRCHAFDARANGFVRGEGGGMIVLKPLARALAEGDRIYAVIRGSAVNQDGHTPGMTVPSQEAQEALLRQAYQNAGVSPASIQFVEAHGTGTLVGDPIEAKALGRVLSAGRPADRPCVIGSVKTNIGHLEAGSGIAGLIKAALALHHRHIPGNLHFVHPNPAIDFEQLRLRVPRHGESWPNHEGPALAGVNSFGFGGTNVHVVLQDAPHATANGRREPAGTCAHQPANAGRSPFLVPLSARGPQALRATADAWQQFLAGCPEEISLHDLASNAALRRSLHDHRLALVAHSKGELAEQLAAFVAGQPVPGASSDRVTAGQRPRLAFVCSGQGPQWWAMGRQLLEQEPIFRATIQRCDEIVRRLGPWSLLEELTADEEHSRMDVTAISQPAIFALQVALAALWRSWGVEPEAAIGHSVGEVAAAHLAGVFSLVDAMRVIYQRGRCMELAPSRGRMLAAGIALEEARRLVAPYGDRISIAAVNGPLSITLSGEAEPLEEIARFLEQRQAFGRFLQVHYAFHSAQMDPVRDELLRSLDGIEPRPATLPLFSTVTGRRLDGREMGSEYWWRNVRQTVQFAEGVDRLVEMGCDTVLELSAHPALTAAVSECYQHHGKKVHVLPSLRRREEERATMLRSLGLLYTLGQSIGWAGVVPGPARHVRLPLYPWQRERCWYESEESRWTRLTEPLHPLLGSLLQAPSPAWETRLDLRLAPFLSDHRIQRTVIVPAAAYLEIAIAVAREVHGPGPWQIDDVKFANPCFLTPDRARQVSTEFHPDDATVRISSRLTDGDSDWAVHCTAMLRPLSPTASPSTFHPEAIRQRCPRPFFHAESYSYFQKMGLDYGPLFQGIERGWQGDRESLAEIRLPDGLTQDETAYLFHPALLDACLQAAIPADKGFPDVLDGLYLPLEIEQIRLHRRPGRRLWVHVRLLERTAQRCVADLDIYNESREMVAQIRGLRGQRVAGSAEESLDELFYASEWRPQPRPERDQLGEPGAWLIFADRGGVGEQLGEMLRAGGERCTLVYAGPAFRAADEDLYEIDPGRVEDMTQLLQAVLDPDRPACRGIVHLGSLDSPQTDDLSVAALERAQEAGLLNVLHLVQAWERTSGDREARLFLVTRGAQSIGDKLEPVAVAQSPAIGLGRVIVNEYPRLRCKMVDLDRVTNAASVPCLFEELGVTDEEDEIALRGSDRYVHRYTQSTGAAFDVGPKHENVPYRLETSSPGTLDALTLRALRRQPPGAGEVEIEVVAAGLNFSDVLKSLDIYPGLGDGPVPLGAECAGRITAIGEGVHGLRVGDEVLAVAPFAFGSHVTTRAELAALKPAQFSFEEAATLPIAFLTASYALDHLAHLSAGERVLIHSATGGVGLAAVQRARRVGAEIFATAGTAEKRDYLKELGIEHVMESRSLAFADEVMDRTGGRGVDVVLNSLAGEALVRSVACLTDYGRFLEIGKRDVYANSRLGLRPFRKNLSLHAIDLDRMTRERPALLGSLLQQLVQEARDGRLAPLPHRVYPIADAADAFRHMQQSKHTGKIVLSMREQPASVAPSEEPIGFRSDATYLITGGLGGFGLAVARWMVERGARHLVLLGRRGIHSIEAGQAVVELEEMGARVVVRQADVAKEDDLIAVLAEIDRAGPPLRGVFHTAMVLDDGLLLNLDRERMWRSLAPKMNGAWNLHTQTLHLPLDCFVLFSSVASVFGHAGQGNYVAANIFLDSLAWYRRARDLPALTINWGYLGEVGYLAQHPEVGERLERQGVLSLSVRQALSLLERAMRRQAIQVGAARLDWSRWRGVGVTGRVSLRFAHLLQHGETAGSQRSQGDGLPTVETIRSAAPDARRDLLDTLLRDKLARVLGTSPDRLDGEKPLLNLGIDSLMAVELRNWIEQELRVNLPILELMRSPSLSCLMSLLLEQLISPSAPAPADHKNGHTAAMMGARAEELIAKIENLPGEQVDALLTSLLADQHSDRSATP